MEKKAKMLSELEELKMAEKDSSTPAEALDGIREAITNLQTKIDGYKERKPKAKAEPKEATKTATVKKPRGTGKPNPDFAKVQQIAKNLKAKDPSLKHTKAVSMAWAEVRGGAPAKTTKTAEKAPEKKAEPKKLDKLKVTAKPKETAKKAVVKKASEAPKKKNDLIEKVKRAKAKVKRVGKTYSYKQNGEVRTFQRDKKKDGLRTAKHVGKRVSKEGNVYYEYRDNRADVNIGKVSYKRPSLYAKGGETSKKYMVFNYTDNIYASPEVFNTKKEANEFIKSFRKRFEMQGYYRDNRMNKIDIEDIDLLAIPSDFSPFRKFAKGGILDAYDQKAFKEWLDDGNVSKNPDGTYSTQDAQYQNRIESLTELKKYFKKEILEFAKGGKTKGKVVVKVRSYNYQNTILMEMAFETERQAEKFADKIENYNDDGYVFSLCGYDSTGKKVVDIYDLSEYSKSDVKKEKRFADCKSWSLKMKVLDTRNTVIYEFTGSFDACFRKFNLLDGEDLYADYKSSYAKGGKVDAIKMGDNVHVVAENKSGVVTNVIANGKSFSVLFANGTKNVYDKNELKKVYSDEDYDDYAKGGSTDSGVSVEVRLKNSPKTLLMEKSFDTKAKAERFAKKINNADSGLVIDFYGYDKKGKMVVHFEDFSQIDEYDIENGIEWFNPVKFKLKMYAENYGKYVWDDDIKTLIYTFSGTYDQCVKKFESLYNKPVVAKVIESSFANGGEMDERASMSYARTKGKESIDWDKELREYVGSNYSKLSEREKKEIISDMQKDFDRRYSFADGGEMDDENQRFDVNPNVTSTLANLQPYLDEYTMRKFGSKFPPETIFVEYYKRPDGTAQIEAVTLSNFTGSKSKRVTVDEIFETYARGGQMPKMTKMYKTTEEQIIS